MILSSLATSRMPARPRTAVGSPDVLERSEPETERLLATMARAGTPYYDAEADARARTEYYRDVDPGRGDLFGQLHELVSGTHANWLSYDAARRLYPWIDLRPGMRLQSIYSPREVGPGEPLRKPTDSPKLFKRSPRAVARLEKKLEQRAELYARAEQWVTALRTAPADAVELAARIAALEAGNYFNCEHAVPQVLYDRQEPMRGDLHQLFTAERDINAVRSNLPLRDFPEYEGQPIPGAEPEGYGRPDGFEPAGGRGPMARAVLFFMVRYPWVMKAAGELGYGPEHLQDLLRWHREDPPGLYERHRNAEIEKEQGNRNPFIDHPEWAFRVDFRPALA